MMIDVTLLHVMQNAKYSHFIYKNLIINWSNNNRKNMHSMKLMKHVKYEQNKRAIIILMGSACQTIKQLQ